MSDNQHHPAHNRRDFLKTAGMTAFTTSLFTGRVRGANDRISIAFIGMGTMGLGNLRYALEIPEFQPVAVCDVWQPYVERAQAEARKKDVEVKGVKDFREIIADKSIDAVCISTPDHWHAYMTVEACKAGKDVFVEKPACTYVEEGQKMVEAARKYQRVVQAGTMQRSGGYFKKAAEIVKSGNLGEITFCHTWQASLTRQEGEGNPPDSDPPEGLDWDLWLGPAPKVPFNTNRWGVSPKRWSTFRYFWDYAGGAMTDWGVHLIDPIHQCFDEVMPLAVSAMGSKFYVKDNLETPDTMLATFYYPKFIASYESRTCNPMPLLGRFGAGTAIHGTEGTLIVTRSGCWVTKNRDSSTATPLTLEKDRELAAMNVPHWKNFLECIKTRQKPVSDIETCVRSTTVCLLANVSLRSKMRVDWIEKDWTVAQKEARPYLKARYRKPWKLEV
ncbi:MAG TPA: Gfo/Idh/MocA family oxidoreductase [Bryobacteraceae bacterium]|nr:Gfo/Idh/MocA family oxidoreductase [Bryobacteraceae bacterium]HOL70591.1 Gfo/Idh/MocA family oxidoreductase [Bryobacteraceae bacterium]HPQ15533.1 Gfo/Idh/MocA family oxidoreductase [Bryobacteraceae bacterium]HPU72117.1 Gfo/Idh/MocA family oxidoreductase [Bryobacteraceae bacterium]